MFQVKPRTIDDTQITVTDTATLLYTLVDTASSSARSQTYYSNEVTTGTGVVNCVSIRPENGDVRIIIGATPTASKGFLVKEGTRYFYHGEISKLYLVRVGGTNVTTEVTYWVVDRGEIVNSNTDSEARALLATVVRSEVILTTGHVAATVLSGCAGYEQLVIDLKYTKGSLTSLEVKVEFSTDGSVYFQDTNSSITTGVTTLTANEFTYAGATGNIQIRLPINANYCKISAKGTGTVTNSLLEITAVLAR